MNRACTLCILPLVGIVVVACDSGTEPPVQGTGVDFALSSGASHSAAGAPAANGDGIILHNEFAVAKADSVGGFAVISYDPSASDPNHGNLFVLQAPRQTAPSSARISEGPVTGATSQRADLDLTVLDQMPSSMRSASDFHSSTSCAEGWVAVHRKASASSSLTAGKRRARG